MPQKGVDLAVVRVGGGFTIQQWVKSELGTVEVCCLFYCLDWGQSRRSQYHSDLQSMKHSMAPHQCLAACLSMRQSVRGVPDWTSFSLLVFFGTLTFPFLTDASSLVPATFSTFAFSLSFTPVSRKAATAGKVWWRQYSQWYRIALGNGTR